MRAGLVAVPLSHTSLFPRPGGHSCRSAVAGPSIQSGPSSPHPLSPAIRWCRWRLHGKCSRTIPGAGSCERRRLLQRGRLPHMHLEGHVPPGGGRWTVPAPAVSLEEGRRASTARSGWSLSPAGMVSLGQLCACVAEARSVGLPKHRSRVRVREMRAPSRRSGATQPPFRRREVPAAAPGPAPTTPHGAGRPLRQVLRPRRPRLSLSPCRDRTTLFVVRSRRCAPQSTPSLPIHETRGQTRTYGWCTDRRTRSTLSRRRRRGPDAQ